MLVFDLFLNSYSYVIFLPFFSYLLKTKRSIILYLVYGLFMDIYLLNFYFANTFLFILIYYLFPRKKSKINLYYIFSYILFFIVNMLMHNNIYFILSPIFIISFIINYSFFLLIHKNFYI